MAEVRGDMKADLIEKNDYHKKKKKSREEKQLKGSFAGGVLRKNITNVPSDLGLRSEGCDLFMEVYYLFSFKK